LTIPISRASHPKHRSPSKQATQTIESIREEDTMQDSSCDSPASGRRSFLKKGIAAGAVGVGVGFHLLGNDSVLAQSEGSEEGSGSLTKGDAAMLRFAAAAEILESDFWVQYNSVVSKTAKYLAEAGIRSTPASSRFSTPTSLNTSTTTRTTRSPTSRSSTPIWNRRAQTRWIWSRSARWRGARPLVQASSRDSRTLCS
jgi:hypothetical protein